MGKFSEVAKKAVNDSVIREGREKADLKSVAAAYPNGMTVIGAELAHTTEKGEPKTYAVIIIKEEPNKYFNCGSAMTKIVSKWLEMYEGDVEAMNADLVKDGGVVFTCEETRLQNGNNYTVINIKD